MLILMLKILIIKNNVIVIIRTFPASFACEITVTIWGSGRSDKQYPGWKIHLLKVSISLNWACDVISHLTMLGS